MRWMAVVIVGFHLLLPFLLAAMLRERRFAARTARVPEVRPPEVVRVPGHPEVVRVPYDWALDHDQVLAHSRPA